MNITKIYMSNYTYPTWQRGRDDTIEFNIDTYKLCNDGVTISVSGNFIHYAYEYQKDRNGTFKGYLGITKDKQFDDEKHFIISSLDVICNFTPVVIIVDDSKPLSENVSTLNDFIDVAADFIDESFEWNRLFKNEKLKLDIIHEINKMFSKNIKDDEDIETLISILVDLNIINDKYYKLFFNKDFDDSLGKIILPYFMKEYNNHVISEEKGADTMEIGEDLDAYDDADWTYGSVIIE